MEVNSYKKFKKDYNIWKETIKFFNSNVGKEVTRQQLLGNVKRFGRRSIDSRDTYRLLLQKAGYLKTSGRGRYLVLKEIPNVSLTTVENFIRQYYQPMGWLPFWGSPDSLTEYQRSKLCS
jgi:hypothetical protein